MHTCLFAIFGSSETSPHVVKEIYMIVQGIVWLYTQAAKVVGT